MIGTTHEEILMKSGAASAGLVEENTIIEIAGRRLPALWIMTEMPPPTPFDDWWADMIASIPMENGYQSVVVRPRIGTGQPWSVCLCRDRIRPENWGGDDKYVNIAFANNESEVLSAILMFSEMHTGSA